jgi:glycosyltransferase involved in cell wall biosynthesis
MRSAVVALATNESAIRERAAMLANGLRSAGRATTLVWVSENLHRSIAPPAVAAGVEILAIDGVAPEQPRYSEFPSIDLARQVAPALRGFEVVYALTAGYPLMHAIRESRHSPMPSPCFIAVLGEVSREQPDPTTNADEIARRFAQNYALTHCDLIVCLGAIGYQRLAELGIAASSPRVVMSSDGTFQAIFDEVGERARNIATTRTERASRPKGAARSSLTICLSHSEHSGNAAGALKALERQSSKSFSMIGIDSSTSIESATIFAEQMEQYRERGWIYRHEPQRGEARAIALSVASVASDYLMFIDTSDELEPRCVERALEAAELSEDDLLEIWSAELADTGEVSSTRGDHAVPEAKLVRASYGIDLVNAMGGGASSNPILMARRKAFEAVGGYPIGLIAGRERPALAVRIAMAGYRCDVLPEILNTRRTTADARRPAIREGDSVRSAFDERLNTINMQSLAMTVQATAQQLRGVEHEVETRQRDLGRRFAIPSIRERLRLLMLVSDFPYPPTSSLMRRRWEMIRFLGERHDLTLATFCSKEQSRQRAEVLRYCRSIYAAANDGPELPEAARMPVPVRQQMRVTMRDALRAIPSDLYDAALIDTMRLAPFGVEINAPTLLGVQSIESRLPGQTTQPDPSGLLTTRLHALERDAELMHGYEDEVWPQFATRLAGTGRDCDEIQLRARSGQTILVENGADLDLWLADARSDTNRILFCGDLDSNPNIDGILHFWHNIRPHLRERRPSIELVVAGSSATAELRSLANQPGFVLVEDPADIKEVAATASVSIAPLRFGPGTGLNILESLALGLPVVSTSIACAGLSLKSDEHLIVRDDAVAFADAVDQLLGTATLWRRLRRNGRAVIGERYRWDRVLAPLESALWQIAR